MEISNKLLVVLLVIAILISITGTIVNLSSIKLITGYATGEGTVNASVVQSTTINVINPDMNFGSGYIAGGNASALLISNGTAINWSGSAVVDPMYVRNDGNVNISLTLASQRNATSFFLNQSGEKTYQFFAENNATTSGTDCISGLQSTPQDLNTSDLTVCSNLGWDSVADTVNVHGRIGFADEIQGNFTDLWTFTSTAV